MNKSLFFDPLQALVGLILVCALALPALGQTRSASGDSAGRSSGQLVQPMDMRIGASSQASGASDRDGGPRQGQLATSPLPVMTLGKDYRLQPTDLVDIEVLDAESLKRTVRVNVTGAISMPLIGQVLVGGLTSQEAEARIAERYREKYLQNPQVSIFIREFATERITIEGAVGRPGIFPLTGKVTLLRALAMAGGFGSIANSNEVKVFRNNDQQIREVFVYNIENIRSGKDEDPPIKGDDLIVVQRDSTRVLLKDSLFRDIIDSINPFSVLAPR